METQSKTALVTGGGRGIGAACAKALGREGFDVAVNYRSDKESAEKVVSEIEAWGQKAVALQADVGVEEEVVRLFEAVDKAFGRLDLLVNNAGVILHSSRVADLKASDLERLWNANITSQFLCAREAVRRMSSERGGRGGAIVNMSSVHARIGAPGEFVAYAASKGAIDSFTQGLALEVIGEGVRVNAVRPGLIATDIHRTGGDAGRAEKLGGTVPIGRAGQPEDIAEAVVWLASDSADYVVGALIDVGGGR